MSSLPDGRRNDTLSRLAGAMHSRGMSPAAIEAALLTENVQRCIPPLPDEEVRAIAANIALYAPDLGQAGSAARERIDGAALLTAITEHLARFIVYPSDHSRWAHGLWIAHAHLMDVWECTPRFAVLSPEWGSGKTRVLEVTATMVPRPVESVNVSPAYLFRKVSDEAGRPTILFDEIDTVFGPKAKENEDLRGMLNAGHKRGATAGRCVIRGKNVEVEELPAYCAVMLAGIGNLPDTILSRSVHLRMRRRKPSERVEQYRRRINAPEGHALRDRLEAWATQVLPSLGRDWPTMPPGVEDRAADVWEPLLAVADAAGGGWPARARAAAVALVAASREHTPSLGARLLGDVRTIFGARESMATKEMLVGLHALEEAPWGDLRGKPLSDHFLAKLLSEYGVKSRNVRTGTGPKDVAKGYVRAELFDVWSRYCPALPPEGATSATSATGSEERL